MCGICGVAGRHLSKAKLERLAITMADTLVHRGPDGSGVWATDGLAMAHRRLAILDLSPAGHQPMVSQDDRWVLSYNGEFYNFQQERKLLEQAGQRFRGHSDTEVLLSLIARQGFLAAIERIVGMFAVAAFDRREKKLYLARDRFGQKPLYYGRVGDFFVFGSELRVAKALGRPLSIEHRAVELMLRYKAIPAPHTIFQGLYKLPQAHWLTFDAELGTASPPHRFWAPPGPTAPEAPDRERISALFEQAVRDRMISDVPLGAFLSGGIDSTLTVAAMQKNSPQPIKTFTIGFSDSAFDEAAHAREVASYLATEHTEFRLTPRDVLDAVPLMPRIFDEPFGDSSQIPTYLVSKLARQRVTVALSGDGGDEFFAGYNRHVWLPKLAPKLALIPKNLRKLLAGIIDTRAVRESLRRCSEANILPIRMVDDKLDKLRNLLKCNGVEDMYRDLLSDWKSPLELLQDPCPPDFVDEFRNIDFSLSVLQRLIRADINLYLPEDILTKVDRATMAVSLEARSPFLDHRLAEYALSVSPESNIFKNSGKRLLREFLGEQIPANLFERPKMGFAVPISEWLRTDLGDWTGDLIHSRWTERGGLLDRQRILTTWQEHRSATRNRHHELWNVLMLLAWLNENHQ